MNIYVGNLTKEVSEHDLERLFTEFGTVVSTKIIRDTINNISKGFGFIEMPVETEALKAIVSLHTAMFHGRHLTVTKAFPRLQDARRQG